GGGAEHGAALLPERARETRHQGHLGADHGEVDVLLVNQVDQRRDVVRGHRRETLGARRDPGVPGGREHARHRRILREAPAQRVLAPPSPDDQNLHAPTTRLCSRAGPTPTIETGTPPSSSRNRTYCCASFGRSSNAATSPISSLHPGSSSHTG